MLSFQILLEGFITMKTLELYDIDEDELRGLLSEIPTIWKNNSGFFDSGLTPVFRNIGELDNLVFGVHIFSHGNRAMLFIILSEYMRDVRIATFNITAKNMMGWFGYTSNNKGELKFKEMLEKLTYEELERFAVEHQYQESGEIFVCPNCSAQYRLRVLRVTEDNKIVCQNCNRLFDAIELNVT